MSRAGFSMRMERGYLRGMQLAKSVRLCRVLIEVWIVLTSIEQRRAGFFIWLVYVQIWEGLFIYTFYTFQFFYLHTYWLYNVTIHSVIYISYIWKYWCMIVIWFHVFILLIHIGWWCPHGNRTVWCARAVQHTRTAWWIRRSQRFDDRGNGRLW